MVPYPARMFVAADATRRIAARSFVSLNGRAASKGSCINPSFFRRSISDALSIRSPLQCGSLPPPSRALTSVSFASNTRVAHINASLGPAAVIKKSLVSPHADMSLPLRRRKRSSGSKPRGGGAPLSKNALALRSAARVALPPSLRASRSAPLRVSSRSFADPPGFPLSSSRRVPE